MICDGSQEGVEKRGKERVRESTREQASKQVSRVEHGVDAVNRTEGTVQKRGSCL